MVSAVTIFGITDNCGGQRSGEHLSAKSAGMNVACTVRQFDQESGAAGFATSLVCRDRGEGGEPVGDCAIELTCYLRCDGIQRSSRTRDLEITIIGRVVRDGNELTLIHQTNRREDRREILPVNL